MRILIVCDKQGTAIDRLAQSVKRNLSHHQVIVAYIHPKCNDIETLVEIQKLMYWADIIDIHYWKSGQVLRTSFPSEFNAKPKILFHFNPYDIYTEENQYYTFIVVGNRSIHAEIPFAHLIPYCIDLDFFKFNDTYAKEPRVMMSVNRIEGKKGIKEVAQVCRELGYPFTLVGRVSKAEYMKEVMVVGGDKMEFIENATDEILREAYYKSAVHVCNSVDFFESGTLPVLESMSIGVPVLTRNVGHISDLYDGSNMVVRKGQLGDTEDLKNQLKSLMENKEWRLKIREKAWDTVKNRDDRRMAFNIQKLYYKLYKPILRLVSVVIPTRDHLESFSECLLGAIQQDYLKMEIVIADSGETQVRKIVNEVKKHTEIPIKYLTFEHKNNYTLAEARNRAVIEADGEILVFCDDRLSMAKNAVSIFTSNYRPKSWLWGSKDKAMKGFVENFSCVGREDLIKYGLFCERMQFYGGMSQEIRERFEHKNDMDFTFISEAQAFSTKRAVSKTKRRKEIIEAKYLCFKLFNK